MPVQAFCLRSAAGAAAAYRAADCALSHRCSAPHSERTRRWALSGCDSGRSAEDGGTPSKVPGRFGGPPPPPHPVMHPHRHTSLCTPPHNSRTLQASLAGGRPSSGSFRVEPCSLASGAKPEFAGRSRASENLRARGRLLVTTPWAATYEPMPPRTGMLWPDRDPSRT